MALRLGIKWFDFVLICYVCLLQVKCLILCSSWERWINPFRRWIFQWPKSKVYIFFFPPQVSMGLIWSKINLKQWHQILIGPLTLLPCVPRAEPSGLACSVVLGKPSVTFRLTLLTTCLRLTNTLLIWVACSFCSSSWWIPEVVLNRKSTDQL